MAGAARSGLKPGGGLTGRRAWGGLNGRGGPFGFENNDDSWTAPRPAWAERKGRPVRVGTPGSQAVIAGWGRGDSGRGVRAGVEPAVGRADVGAVRGLKGRGGRLGVGTREAAGEPARTEWVKWQGRPVRV